VLYVSHVHAKWIKQRPHFLAESFQSLGYDTSFAFSSITKRGKLVRGQNLEVRLRPLVLMPQSYRTRFNKVSLFLDWLAYIKIVAIVKPNYVLVSHPRFISIARRLSVRGIPVIYDCMDLNSAFDEALSQDSTAEIELVKISDLTICSSSKILESLKMTLPSANLKLVRNALSRDRYASLEEIEPIENRVGYFGTISSWFDWEAVLDILKHFERMEIHLWGPMDSKNVIHPRIIYHSQIPHSQVVREMLTCRILIMPFSVTPLIEGVDPVKLYEYVATGRPVISCAYPEIRHFSPFIETYSSLGEVKDVITKALSTPILYETNRRRFVDDNNWLRRAEEISGFLRS
jgi:glycosyltransferase involved in cell wall biosynthesis